MITLQERAALTILYQEPWRHYHTLEHIYHLLRLMDGLSCSRPAKNMLEHAIWYHDAVYDPKSTNEKNVKNSLELYELSTDKFSIVASDAIKATIDHDVHEEHTYADLINCFLDMDLEVLSWRPEEYDKYKLQIRKEYSWCSDYLYRCGRLDALEKLKGKGVLYKSSHFSYCEERARANIDREIIELNQFFEKEEGEKQK